MSSGTAMERRWDAAEQDPVHAAAAEWLVRLQDPTLTLDESLEWQRWIEADERHARAFERLENIWDRPWNVLGSEKRRVERSRATRRTWALAASAAGIAAMAGWLLIGNPAGRSAASSEVVHTIIGENRTIHLSDGSSVTLGGRSQLAVSMEPRARRLELLTGEAYFTVAKDPGRPFTVRAGGATVTAVGTEFNVRRSSDRVVVAVVEGRVAVAPEPPLPPVAWLMRSSAREPTQLSAGQFVTFAGDEVKETSRLADPATSTAWRSGQLIFREEPLRYAVEDVNRYSPKPIVIADEAIGEIRISGTVLDADVQGWLQTLQSAFGLEIRQEPGRIVLERLPAR